MGAKVATGCRSAITEGNHIDIKSITAASQPCMNDGYMTAVKQHLPPVKKLHVALIIVKLSM